MVGHVGEQRLGPAALLPGQPLKPAGSLEVLAGQVERLGPAQVQPVLGRLEQQLAQGAVELLERREVHAGAGDPLGQRQHVVGVIGDLTGAPGEVHPPPGLGLAVITVDLPAVRVVVGEVEEGADQDRGHHGAGDERRAPHQRVAPMVGVEHLELEPARAEVSVAVVVGHRPSALRALAPEVGDRFEVVPGVAS